MALTLNPAELGSARLARSPREGILAALRQGHAKIVALMETYRLRRELARLKHQLEVHQNARRYSRGGLRTEAMGKREKAEK
jgi:hypothetical protein